MSDAVRFQIQFLFQEVKGQRSNMIHACHVVKIKTKVNTFLFGKHLFFFFSPVQRTCSEKACIFPYLIVKIYIQRTSLFVCSERARVIGELMMQRKALAAKQLDTVDSLNYSDAGSASLCSTCHYFKPCKLALFYAISPSSW